ncbi:MAG: glutamate-cysteine ligase family protein [Micromonosporaceae bacterium]
MAGPLTLGEAEAYLAAAGFRTGPIGRVGVELEWLVRDRSDPFLRPSVPRLYEALAGLGDLAGGDDGSPGGGALPGGGRLSIEPGGQLELSSAPAASLDACVATVTHEAALVRDALDAAGLVLEGSGLDVVRTPHRVLDVPRYAALEAYYDRLGGDGRAVMCNSASVQVCLDAGDDSDGWPGYRYRWRLADSLGPVLLAAFANSPGRSGSGARLRSTRQLHRFGTDATRTRTPRGDLDPRRAWSRYALAARVAFVRQEGPAPWLTGEGGSFRDWLRGGGPRPPELADLELHLGTLVPPVRPRGYLEFRMIDAQPGADWVVPLAVTTALLDDPVAADIAAAACEPLRSLRRHRDWVRAARTGLSDPALGAAAMVCFEAAIDALGRMPVAAEIRAAVVGFADRYPARGRCPADDAFAPVRRRRPAAGPPASGPRAEGPPASGPPAAGPPAASLPR